ncbi:hypothetical protein H5T87_00870 [bacterium]|nr:hypothetical protein [bacterium]
MEQRRNFTIYKLSFESPYQTIWEENNRVIVYLFSPPNPRGKVLVFHTLGTKNLDIEKEICRRFAQLGYEGAAIVLPFHLERCPKGLRNGWGFTASPKLLKESTIQSVADARSFLDFWCGENERVAVIGLSLGAIIGVLTMAVDERITTGVFILGGGNIPLLLPHSIIFSLRSYKWRKEELEELDEIDPLKYAHLILPRKVLMVNGRLDLVIPYNSSYSLWVAMGKPEIKWLWCGHYGALFIKDKILRKVLKFIIENHNKTQEVR